MYKYIFIPAELIAASELGANRVSLFYNIARTKDSDDRVNFNIESVLARSHISAGSSSRNGGLTQARRLLRWLADHHYLAENYEAVKLKEYVSGELAAPKQFVKVSKRQADIISSDALLVWSCIRLKLYESDRIPQAMIAKITGLDIRTVFGAIDELAAKKIISFRAVRNDGTYIRSLVEGDYKC